MQSQICARDGCGHTYDLHDPIDDHADARIAGACANCPCEEYIAPAGAEVAAASAGLKLPHPGERGGGSLDAAEAQMKARKVVEGMNAGAAMDLPERTWMIRPPTREVPLPWVAVVEAAAAQALAEGWEVAEYRRLDHDKDAQPHYHGAGSEWHAGCVCGWSFSSPQRSIVEAQLAAHGVPQVVLPPEEEN